MRALILAVTVLGVLAGANAAQAGLSTTLREEAASVDTATVPDEATQQTEDQIGLTKARRREVQRRLAKLGPRTLAVMHGSSFSGAAAPVLESLAGFYDDRLRQATPPH